METKRYELAVHEIDANGARVKVVEFQRQLTAEQAARMQQAMNRADQWTPGPGAPMVTPETTDAGDADE
ncbi:MAG: hypothetical protein ACE5EX_00135 [Phycisphaerae bacterium]